MDNTILQLATEVADMLRTAEAALKAAVGNLPEGVYSSVEAAMERAVTLKTMVDRVIAEKSQAPVAHDPSAGEETPAQTAADPAADGAAAQPSV